MKNKYFTLLLLFSCLVLSAQNSVNINVTDAVSSLAIENADVTLNATTLQTDASGDVTFVNIADGLYAYTITKDCYLEATGSVTVSGAEIFETATMDSQTSAPVFVLTSSNPIIGAWVDGNINLTDGNNTYNADITEFDNILPAVAFGTYNYTFTRSGGCYPEVTGTLTVDCDAINAQSGNVLLNIVADQPEVTIDITVDQVDNVLTANAAGVSISYQWLDCNNGNTPIDGETNQSFTAIANGSYAVVITNSTCGISDTSICYDITTLSVDQLNPSLEVSLYPNPANDDFTVTLGNNYKTVQLEIYSITGQLIQNVNHYNRSEFNVNISKLSTGMYIIKLNADGTLHTSRILKN